MGVSMIEKAVAADLFNRKRKSIVMDLVKKKMEDKEEKVFQDVLNVYINRLV